MFRGSRITHSHWGEAVKKNELKKQLQRYKREIEAAASRDKALRKEIKRLKKEIGRRDRIIAEGDEYAGEEVAADPLKILQGQRNRGVASAHKKAWARHQYLRDRYEHHLQAGSGKVKARELANADLVDEYGAAEGYSGDALQDILS